MEATSLFGHTPPLFSNTATASAAAALAAFDERRGGIRRPRHSRGISALASLLVTLWAPVGFAVATESPQAFDIGQQPLTSALNEFAQQSGRQILFATKVVTAKRTNGIKGELEPEAALESLLEGTGLTFRVTADQTILVNKPGETAGIPASANPIRFAQVDPGRARSAANSSTPEAEASAADSDAPNEDSLRHVIVTARKKVERLQDVPMPVTVISAEKLLKSNKNSLRDFASQIPGLTDVGGQGMSIRGLSMGMNSNPTVGFTIDDVSTGSSTFSGGSAFMPEVDPADIESIEVLRGPQGSLYGAASPSGLIRYVTADPSTTELKGQVRAGANTIKNGGTTGYSGSGSINVPLAATLAVRASTFARREPGFVDNPVRGIDGINESRASGGNVAFLWKPAETFSLKLSAMYQDNELDGDENSYTDTPGLGIFKQNEMAGTGIENSTYKAFSARMRLKLGVATLTSVTGYNEQYRRSTSDVSRSYGPDNDVNLIGATEEFFGVPNDTTGVSDEFINRTNKLTQELRVETPLGSTVDLVLGGFYGRERSTWDTVHLAVFPDTGQVAGNWGHSINWAPYTDEALFTDVTVRLTDRFDVQLGGRYSRTEQSYRATDEGPFLLLGGGGFFQDSYHVREKAVTYSLAPRLKLTPNLMTYLRLASGYSPGGANANADSSNGIPKTYKPNKTLNYELGVKGEAFAQRLTFDASVYYIDWKDLPVDLQNSQEQFYTGNSGGAKTQGVELSIQVMPTSGLTVSGWVTFSDAQLTTDFPPGFTVARRGERLPYSARRSANLSVDQEFPLRSATASVGTTLTYAGSHLGDFVSLFTPERPAYAGYTTLDLRASLDFEMWTIDWYANNATDKRALLYGGTRGAGEGLTAFTYITPRTIGLSVNRRF